MISVCKLGNNLGVGFSFGGPNFSDILELVKAYKLKYKPQVNLHRNVWIGKGRHLLKLLDDLSEIEEFEVPEWFMEEALPPPETQKYRIPVSPDLLKSNPLGEFQYNGIKRLVTQNRAMLAWEMGLGKTYTVISALNHLWHKELIDGLVVIAPSESIYNFKREIVQFNSVGFTEEDIYIANRHNRTPFETDKKIIIMTYRTFLMLSDDAYKKNNPSSKAKDYRKPPIDISTWASSPAIVLDESHKIKNTKARQTKVLHLHKKFFPFRYLLSGTPDPNGVEGYYSQLKFLDESIIGNDYFSWLDRVAYLGNNFASNAITGYKEEEVKKFVEEIKPWVDRQFVKDNIDLPDLTVKRNYLPLSDKQEEIYREITQSVLAFFRRPDGSIAPKEVANAFPYLLQSLHDPCLLLGKDFLKRSDYPSLFRLVEKWKFKDHSKLEPCSSLLESYIKEQGHKVILWGGHPDTLNRLSDYYAKYNPVTIHGQIQVPKGMSQTEYKNKLLEAFKTSKESKLLIASYYVLSTAVNITEAPRSIYWDVSLNPVDYFQSLKRNHRIGQDQQVISNLLITERTVEETLDNKMQNKENLNQMLFKADSLSKEQWKALFTGQL